MENTTALVKINPQFDSSVTALYEEAQKLVQYAESFVVLNPQDVKRATEDLSLISNLKKSIEERRKEYTGPLNEHLKQINSSFKLFSEPLDAADKALRGKILAYNAEQQRLKAEAEKAEALRKQAAEIEAKLTQETGEIFDHPEAVITVEAHPVNKAYTDVGTMGTRKVRKWELVDFSLVADEFKVLDAAKITKLVKAGIGSIAGLRIYEEDTIAIFSKKGE